MVRRLIVLLALCACTASAVSLKDIIARMSVGGAPPVDLTQNLQHYWRGATGTNDSGSTPQSLITYGTITASTNGWDFGTGDTNYFRVNGPITNGTSYTISVWAKPNKTAMDANDYGGWIFEDRAGNDDWHVVYWKSTGKFLSTYWNNFVTASDLHSTNAVVNAVWVHIAVVMDNASGNGSGTQSIYINGSLSASKTMITNNPRDASTLNAVIGGQYASLGYPYSKYHGELDNIRFYSTNKPASFIQAIYDSEKGAKGL